MMVGRYGIVALVVWVLLWGRSEAQFGFDLKPGLTDTSRVVPALEVRGAIASLERGDPTAAAVELRDVIRRNETHVQAHRLLVSAYLRLGDDTQALNACRALARLDSTDAGVLTTLGYLHQKMGDLTGAERHYKVALTHNNTLVQAYQGLGWVYLKTGRLEAALDMVTETSERAPNYAPNYILMGRVLTAQGFFEDAAIAYNRAFALQGNLRERYGILLQELGLRHRIGR